MLEFPRHATGSDAELRIKIIGLGNAGGNLLDRIILDGLPGVDLAAVNTDSQALAGSVATEKVQLGQATTRGLGAGGDPEVGRMAIEENVSEVVQCLHNTGVLVIIAGLGGGTASGAVSLLAQIAHEHQVRVVIFATLPFAFEGRRRTEQALGALAAAKRWADVAICFENDKMAELVSPKAGINDAFAAADATLAQSVRSFISMVSRRGPLRISYDEIATVCRSQQARTLFGYGEAAGDNRSHEALEEALRNPLLEKGNLLEEAAELVVHLTGGRDLAMYEVQIVMDEVNRLIDHRTRLHLGVSVQDEMNGRLGVSLLGAVDALPTEAIPLSAPLATREPARTSSLTRTPSAPAPAPMSVPAPIHEEEEFEPAAAMDEPYAASAIEPEPAEETPSLIPAWEEAVKPSLLKGNKNGVKNGANGKGKEQKAEQMQFEPVNRGRFEKSEPTIIDGQDLDIPTFMRRNVPLK